MNFTMLWQSRSVSLLEAVKYCISTALICIGMFLCVTLYSVMEMSQTCKLHYVFLPGFTMLVDSIMWRRILWPEFEVLWFNSVLNRSSEWGVSYDFVKLHLHFLPQNINLLLSSSILLLMFYSIYSICCYKRTKHGTLVLFKHYALFVRL